MRWGRAAARCRCPFLLPMKNVEQELEVLKHRVIQIGRDVGRLREWQDVVSSPIYKRVWFFVCGWKWSSLGRWYAKERWNG